jgi:hypothetical protein
MPSATKATNTLSKVKQHGLEKWAQEVHLISPWHISCTAPEHYQETLDGSPYQSQNKYILETWMEASDWGQSELLFSSSSFPSQLLYKWVGMRNNPAETSFLAIFSIYLGKDRGLAEVWTANTLPLPPNTWAKPLGVRGLEGSEVRGKMNIVSCLISFLTQLVNHVIVNDVTILQKYYIILLYIVITACLVRTPPDPGGLGGLKGQHPTPTPQTPLPKPQGWPLPLSFPT